MNFISEWRNNESFRRWIVSFLFIIFAFIVLRQYVLTLMMSWVVSLAVFPYFLWIKRKLKASDIIAAVCSNLTGLFLIIIPSLVFVSRGSKLIFESAGLFLDQQKNNESSNEIFRIQIESVINFFNKILASFQFELNKAEVFEISNKILLLLSEKGVEVLNLIISSLPGAVLDIMILNLGIIYFLIHHHRIHLGFQKSLSFENNLFEAIIGKISVLSRAIFISNIFTGLLQGLFVGVVAFLCGFNEFFIILFISFVGSFIPLVGAAPVAIVLSVYSFATNEFALGVVLLIAGIIVVLSDNFIRPMTLSGHSKVPSLLIFLSILGGVSLFGIMGLFAGPLIISLSYEVIPMLAQKSERTE